MISKRVKLNISAALTCVGIVCVLARAWEVIMAPCSGLRWFELCGMVLMTYLCFDNWRIYRRQLADLNKNVASDGEQREI